MTKIIKNSGDIVEFDRNKLKNSLLKSGASKQLVGNILNHIESQLYEGISTKKIYKEAFAHLKKAAGSHAARYNLRAGLQHLGPAGFFFEKFIARLYAEEGYETVLNLTLQGKCVSHEIDIATRKNQEISFIECKFHNSRDATSDVKVPMYILSRFNDLKHNKHTVFTAHDTINNCIIATNNRFTTDAIKFASCTGLQMLSWDYPKESSISRKVDHNGLYPVTCLTTLSMAEKESLLILGIIMAKDLINNLHPLRQINLSDNRIKNVIKEVSELCNYL